MPKPVQVEERAAADEWQPPVLEPVQIEVPVYPEFRGVRVALLHTANTGGELEPCG